MQQCDRHAIEKLNIPSLTLMENAAKAVKEEFLKFYKGGGIAVVCGGGNNGGDGAAFARLLHGSGINCDVYFFYSKTSADCAANIERLKKTDVNIYFNKTDYNFDSYSYIVDALFGTGVNKAVTGIYADIINSINASKARKISIDMPSGLYGGIDDCSAVVKADITITLAAYKYEQLFAGRDYCGEIIVKDIAIPVNCGSFIYQSGDIKKFFPKRKADTHKGSYGKLCIIAGSGRYCGAAMLSCSGAAALRSGCGLVCLCVPKILAQSIRCNVCENILEYLPDDGENAIFDSKILSDIMQKYDALCIGMGMGNNENTYKICEYVIKNYDKKLLLDADALNSIAKYNSNIFKENKNCDIVITPHIAEFSRLINAPIDDIKKHPLNYAQNYAAENNITVLLKGASTVICNDKDSAINITGTPAMAKAGSGDVLSGIIGGVMTQGNDALTSAVIGAYLHGKAGEYAARKLGEYGVLAGDIAAQIPYVINDL